MTINSILFPRNENEGSMTWYKTWVYDQNNWSVLWDFSPTVLAVWSHHMLCLDIPELLGYQQWVGPFFLQGCLWVEKMFFLLSYWVHAWCVSGRRLLLRKVLFFSYIHSLFLHYSEGSWLVAALYHNYLYFSP